MKEFWEISILKCYKDLRGKACNKDIYDNIGNYIKLTDEHLKIQYKRPAYRHQIRKYIANLVKAGCLIKIENGFHEITEKGLERLDKLSSIEKV